MFNCQENITGHTKRQKKKTPQFEEIEQALEPDIAEMLEFSDREIKTTLIC